jgi:hypothetical protein
MSNKTRAGTELGSLHFLKLCHSFPGECSILSDVLVWSDSIKSKKNSCMIFFALDVQRLDCILLVHSL